MAKNYRHFLPIHEVLQKDYSNDDEFTSRVSLELCLPENRDAAVKLLAADTRSRCSRVFVEGYNTSLPADEIKLALFKHFSSSCGGVFDVVVPVDPETNLLGSALVYLEGKNKKAYKRALAFNGACVEGFTAIVLPCPGERECPLDPEQANFLRTVYDHKKR